jgi:hypothetical protein
VVSLGAELPLDLGRSASLGFAFLLSLDSFLGSGFPDAIFGISTGAVSNVTIADINHI